MKYLAAFLLLIPVIAASAQISDYTEGQINWEHACFRLGNGTSSATIQVIDPDMNKFSDSTDTISIFVHSDSSPEGIVLTLYETEKDSGIFERTFGISNQRTAPNILYTQEGDTITAEYVDTTTPSQKQGGIKISETAFIGCSSPPLERVPASSVRIMNSSGNVINNPMIGKQIRITSDIANGQNREQKFAWITQITDEQDKIVSVGWITGMLNSESAFSPSTSWIPQKEGKYTATVFVWESLDNPTALSPPIFIDFEVMPKEQDAKAESWRALASHTVKVFDGKAFFASEPLGRKTGVNDTLTFMGMQFTHPSFPKIANPAGFISTTVTFADGAKETIGTNDPSRTFPVFTQHLGPQAGLVMNQDGTLSLLVSTNMAEISPLEQFKSGIPIDQIQCKDRMVVAIKASDNSPACVKQETLQILREWGWVEPLGNIVFQKPSENINNTVHEFEVPKEFSTGHKLLHIGSNGEKANLAEYFDHDSSIMLFYEYCNCTESPLADKKMTRSNSQILNVNGISVIAYPQISNYADDVNDKYVFEFYYDGYRISLHTDQKLNSGLSLVKEILNFESNAKESNYQREITVLGVSPKNVTLPEPKNQTYKTTCDVNGVCFTPE